MVGESLLVPYGISDSAVGFATIEVADILETDGEGLRGGRSSRQGNHDRRTIQLYRLRCSVLVAIALIMNILTTAWAGSSIVRAISKCTCRNHRRGTRCDNWWKCAMSAGASS
jgi:hypothetical protein